jgi:AN1-like Zinc finger
MSSSSSSAPSPNRDRDQQLLAVGRQCSHPSCRLVDFLPFKCQHCANSFCADHFKPASHSCPKYDEAKFNRVVPDCEHRSCLISYRLVQLMLCALGPLCNEPVPIPPGQDPNIRMERHLSIDCSVMTGRSQKASSTPRCARPKCGKLLFAQIQCDVSFDFAAHCRSFDSLFVEMPSEVLPGTSFPEFT